MTPEEKYEKALVEYRQAREKFNRGEISGEEFRAAAARRDRAAAEHDEALGIGES